MAWSASGAEKGGGGVRRFWVRLSATVGMREIRVRRLKIVVGVSCNGPVLDVLWGRMAWAILPASTGSRPYVRRVWA